MQKKETIHKRNKEITNFQLLQRKLLTSINAETSTGEYNGKETYAWSLEHGGTGGQSLPCSHRAEARGK